MAELKHIRHEYFVREYLKCGGNGAEAYRRTARAYPWGSKWISDNDARVVACVILKRDDVKLRLQELRANMAKKADITMEKILTDYEEALNIAKAQAKPNEIVNAATAQAKLVGLLRDRVEHGDVGDFEGMDNLSDIIAKVGEEIGPDAALALSKILGVDNAETAKEEATGLIDQPPPSDSVN